MSRVRLYVATSLDGFIADREGSVDWLDQHNPRDYGFDDFFAEVGAVIMGRRTYEFVRAIGDHWPYSGKRAFVMSSRTLVGVPDGVLPKAGGIGPAIEAARAATRKDIWIVGGAVAMQSALDAGRVDLIETFLVPVLLGRGLPLIADLAHRQTLSFEGIETFQDGVVKLSYVPQKPPRPGVSGA
ncbi:MAG: dihydrofolate reductase [Hyphomicrobium sp.]|nr:dihydrofolate reductase [Hyphomicrobium sp.]PPC83548.1 MAG: dihydrofolate reductase [Hyphomicrobium sp.]